MSTKSPKPLNIWMPMLFSGVLILGMVFGYMLNKSSATITKSITSIIQNDRLEEIITLINNRYVDGVDEEDLYRDGINGILSKLDPHTFYIPPELINQTNDNLSGTYKGIGLEYNIMNDTLVVISTVPGGPADEAGVELGDKIISINNEFVSREGTSMDEVRAVLGKSRSDTVILTVLPFKSGEFSDIAVYRQYIHTNSVDVAYRLNHNIGFIRINKFTEDTYNEFKAALMGLEPATLEGLILDLRQNSGGYMETAIQVLDEFIAAQELLLTVNGKTFKKEVYTATAGGAYETGKLVVLIDETTASASEIVAGAVQDLDRGVVVGRSSFGKGLVQEQFDLSDGSALRLTIARYYTPTGRSIQRDYSKGRAKYEKDTEERMKMDREQQKVENGEEKYYTLVNHRTVYSGLGIVPDVRVPYKAFMLQTNMQYVTNVLENFVNNYFSQNIEEFTAYRTLEHFEKDFIVSSKMLQIFRKEVDALANLQGKSAGQSAEEQQYIKTLIKAQLGRLMYRDQGFLRVLNQEDDMVLKSLEVFKDKEYNKILHNK